MPEDQGMALNLLGGTEEQASNMVEAIRDFFAEAGLDGVTDLNVHQMKICAAIRFFGERLHPEDYAEGRPKEGKRGFSGFDYSLNPYIKKMNISNNRMGRGEGKDMIRAVLGFDPREGQQQQGIGDFLKR